MKKKRIIFLLALFLTSCWQTNTSSEMINHLQNKPNDFKELVSKCFSDPTLLNNLNKTVDFKDLRPETKSAIEKTEFGTIRFVSLVLEKCDIERSIKVEILNTKNEHLEFSQCKDTLHKPGQSETLPDGFIKVYYLNDQWTIWVDRDPI